MRLVLAAIAYACFVMCVLGACRPALQGVIPAAVSPDVPSCVQAASAGWVGSIRVHRCAFPDDDAVCFIATDDDGTSISCLRDDR